MIKMRRVRIRRQPKPKRQWWPGGFFMLIGLVYALTGEGIVPNTKGDRNRPPIEIHWRATPGWTRAVGVAIFVLGARSVFRRRKNGLK